MLKETDNTKYNVHEIKESSKVKQDKLLMTCINQKNKLSDVKATIKSKTLS